MFPTDRLAVWAARLLPPERAHEMGLWALRRGLTVPVRPRPQDPSALRTTLAGLALSNPVGVAAGLDKRAEAPDRLVRLGFGFVECGSVTPLPQPGNPGRVVFRLARERALINRYGFPSDGLTAFRRNVERWRLAEGVLGINLGANKDSSDRIGDYVEGLKTLWGLADYFAINISSPNTADLRRLQERGALEDLLGRLREAWASLKTDSYAPPLFLKVAPDLESADVDAISEVAERYRVDGLIVSNTTVDRPASLTSAARDEAGGLSGRPLFAKSTEMLRLFRQATGGRMTLLGVGGVESGATAYAKIRAGATAVQLYTALVYEGPGLARRITRDLARRLAADGFASVGEAVGVDAPV